MKPLNETDANFYPRLILEAYKQLNEEDAAYVRNGIQVIENHKTLKASTFDTLVYDDDLSPKPYIDVLRCPACHSPDIYKNGRSRGIQRYFCKSCHKTFTPSSKTLSSHTKQDIGVWVRFIGGLLKAHSCVELSKECNISVTTALNWRLKVFAALEYLAKDVVLSGIIYADDTRFDYSFKGNHGEAFIAPRKPHKRGKQNTRKNCQRNQLCVLCALDAAGHSFSRYIGFGNPSGKRLSLGFQDKLQVDETTVLVTDGARSFRRTVSDYAIPRWERNVSTEKNGKRYPNVTGELHIQIINSYHSRVKRLVSLFRGVSSRYLPGYLLLFDYLENNRYLSDEERVQNILNAMAHIPSEDTLTDLADRYTFPVSNGQEEELWELKVPRKEQAIYRDCQNGMSTKEVCEKHKINRRKIYSIRDKVKRYNLHDKIMQPTEKPRAHPIYPTSDRNWTIFLRCYRDGHSQTEVAAEYGISKQRVNQIVKQVSQRPESAMIKKYTPPKKVRHTPVPSETLHKRYKLIHLPETTYQSTYQIMAKQYGYTPRSMENRILAIRRQENDIRNPSPWKEERRMLSPEDYRAFLEERNRRMYEDIIHELKAHPELSQKAVLQQIAQQYQLSASHIGLIYFKMRKGENVLRVSGNRDSFARRREIYESVVAAEKRFPQASRIYCFKEAAKTLGLSYRTVGRVFYQYRKIMQQEQIPVPEQSDES